MRFFFIAFYPFLNLSAVPAKCFMPITLILCYYNSFYAHMSTPNTERQRGSASFSTQILLSFRAFLWYYIKRS